MVLHNASNGRAWSRGDGQPWRGWGLQASLLEWTGVTVRDGRAVGLKLYLCNLMGKWNHLWCWVSFEVTSFLAGRRRNQFLSWENRLANWAAMDMAPFSWMAFELEPCLVCSGARYRWSFAQGVYLECQPTGAKVVICAFWSDWHRATSPATWHFRRS